LTFQRVRVIDDDQNAEYLPATLDKSLGAEVPHKIQGKRKPSGEIESNDEVALFKKVRVHIKDNGPPSDIAQQISRMDINEHESPREAEEAVLGPVAHEINRRHKTRRRREAEEKAGRVNLTDIRGMERTAISKRERRGEDDEETRRLVVEAIYAEAARAETAYAEARAPQPNTPLSVERQLVRSVHILQQDPLSPVDRGAEALRLAQEAERRRRDNDFYTHGKRSRHDRSRRKRSIAIFDDDDDRHTRYRI
jgi:hypothetical protein